MGYACLPLIPSIQPTDQTCTPISDQFCSLVFTLSHVYFTACAYTHHFPSDVFTRCGVQSHAGWSVQFALAILPFVVRLVQSVRRYADSKLPTHLINVSPDAYPFLRALADGCDLIGRQVYYGYNILPLVLYLALPWYVAPFAHPGKHRLCQQVRVIEVLLSLRGASSGLYTAFMRVLGCAFILSSNS